MDQSPLLTSFLMTHHVFDKPPHKSSICYIGKNIKTHVYECESVYLVVLKTITWNEWTDTKHLERAYNIYKLNPKLSSFMQYFKPKFFGRFIYGEAIFVYLLPLVTSPIHFLTTFTKAKKERKEIFKCCYFLASFGYHLCEFNIGSFVKFNNSVQLYDLDLIQQKIVYIHPRETYMFNPVKDKYESKPYTPDLLQDYKILQSTYDKHYKAMFLKDVCHFLSQTMAGAAKGVCTSMCVLKFVDTGKIIHSQICINPLLVCNMFHWDLLYNALLQKT